MRALVAVSVALVLTTSLARAEYIRQSGENANTEAAEADQAERDAAAAQKKQQELDAAYKAALEKNKPAAAAHDPWSNMR
ncbi:MAG TPA: hypothetical protein VMR17_19155 [Xanthobacteraceae bacterium]|nr:hypothetical protein [Xanthobacteraceae bacterium]